MSALSFLALSLLGVPWQTCSCAPEITPQPKQLTDTGDILAINPADGLAIVVGTQASEPERYARDRLAELLQRRFGLRARLATEDLLPADAGCTVVLGQPGTCALVKELWDATGLDDHELSHHHDAYALDVLPERRLAVICGTNDRGVIYGAQTLFRLLSSTPEGLALPAASVRDWPSILWRGRPHSKVSTHLQPGVMDAYLWAGLNFIDVRAGAFGYGPDAELDVAQIGSCITQAHRRGLYVYGTVSCGIKPNQFDGAIRTFRRLIELGVDGLWISFDDPGGGESTMDLVRRVIELGREHGMTGRDICTTPPMGSYQVIDTEFNREMAKQPGMARATWFFTRPPCAADRETAASIWLQRPVAWWHNWPRSIAGFTHGSYGGTSFRVDGRPSYMEIVPLSDGWHKPRYEALQDAAQNADTAMTWGGWEPEYISAVMGVWAWDPEHHDFERTCRAIRKTVYGPSGVQAATGFDAALAEVKQGFLLPERTADPAANYPPRPRPQADRAALAALVHRMAAAADALAATAPVETLLEPERLESFFLEPMRAELAAARALASLQRPEDWWPEHEARCFSLLAAGDEPGLEAACAQVRPTVETQLEALLTALGDILRLEDYAKLWRQRAAGGVDYWKAERDRRAEAARRRIEAQVKAALDTGEMMGRLDSPPGGGRLLSQVTPAQLALSPLRHTGAWVAGPYPHGEPQAFVMAFPAHTASVAGELCQVSFPLRVPEHTGRLQVQLHLTDEYDSDRWTGYRFYQLLSGEEVIWEEDIALTRRGGGEWSNVDVTRIAPQQGELELALRLLDKRPVGNYTTTIFVGPVRLVEVQ